LEKGIEKLKIGFFIANSSELKTLGGLINECLKSYQVYVFTVTKTSNETIKKRHVYLDTKTFPKFKWGKPRLIFIKNSEDFYHVITKNKIKKIFFHIL